MHRSPILARRSPRWLSVALAGALAVPIAFAAGHGTAEADHRGERTARQASDDDRPESNGRDSKTKDRGKWRERSRGDRDVSSRSWHERKRRAGAWATASDSRPSWKKDRAGDGQRRDRDERPVEDGEVETPAETEQPATPAADVSHGSEVAAGNTGPTAYNHPDLERTVTDGDLTSRSGTVTTSRDGEVIELLDLTGNIVIRHDDVTIRAVRIRNAGSAYSISSEGSPSNTTIEYVEIDGRNRIDNIGIYLGDFTLRNANIYGQRVGVNFRSNSTIENSYVHSQATEEGSHNTAMSIHGGSNVVVRGNNLEGSTSAALSLYPRVAPIQDALVEDNVFNGGSYCTYAGYTSNHDYRDGNRDIRFVGNVFGNDLYPNCGQFGPVHAFNGSQPGNVWEDNTDAAGNSVSPS